MSMENEEKVGVKYDKYIELNPKDVFNVCKLIEPLTNSSIDEFGKCVYFTCVDKDTVEVKYYNNPYVVIGKIKNKSGKVIKDFAILVSTLRNLLTNAFESLVLVEKDDEINLVFGEQLIFIETRQLNKDVYVFEEKVTEGVINNAAANYAFKVVGSVLAQTERASERIVIVKDGSVVFNTGVFAASIKSPFSGDEEMAVYKHVVDSLAVMSEITKDDLQYGVSNVLTIKTSEFYCEFPVGLGDKVKMFISPSTQMALQFNADVVINDEFLYKLVRFVQSLDYLSNTVKVSFNSSVMAIELTAENSGRAFPYNFPIVSGSPEVVGDMAITIGVLKLFLDIVGSDVKYSFNDMGLGIKNDMGVFLVRK